MLACTASAQFLWACAVFIGKLLLPQTSEEKPQNPKQNVPIQPRLPHAFNISPFWSFFVTHPIMSLPLYIKLDHPTPNPNSPSPCPPIPQVYTHSHTNRLHLHLHIYIYIQIMADHPHLSNVPPLAQDKLIQPTQEKPFNPIYSSSSTLPPPSSTTSSSTTNRYSYNSTTRPKIATFLIDQEKWSYAIYSEC